MKNAHRSVFIVIALAALAALAACNLQISTSADNPALVVAQLTIQAQQATLTALAAQPGVTGTPAAAGSICDQAQFIADITIPDGTTFNANKSFTKTWELKNTGTCTWTTAYTLTFFNGDEMSGPTPVNLSSSVAPGQSIDLSVPLKSPNSPGAYRGYWILRNGSGTIVPIVDGYQGQSFYVQISVVTNPVVVKASPTSTSSAKVKVPLIPLNPIIIQLLPTATPTIDFSKLFPPIFPLP